MRKIAKIYKSLIKKVAFLLKVWHTVWLQNIFHLSIYSYYYRLIEKLIISFQLPPLLQPFHGKHISSREQWENDARPAIFDYYKNNIYGILDIKGESKVNVTYETVSEEILDFIQDEGLKSKHSIQVIRKEVRIRYTSPKGSRDVIVLVFLPYASPLEIQNPNSIPLLIGLNFEGNHTVLTHPPVNLTISPHTRKWQKSQKQLKKSIGNRASRWPIYSVLKRGFGLITAFYGDFYLDQRDGFNSSIYSILRANIRKKNHGGAIAAWSWGYSQLLDYAVQNLPVDPNHLYLIGHSRLGKTVLWAAACDIRVSGVFANASGCMGAALSNRKIGELHSSIRIAYPYWFNPQFLSLNYSHLNETIDQHFLLALIAPRKLYLAGAAQDIWADPVGEFHALKHAAEIYRFYGAMVPHFTRFPLLSSQLRGVIGFHIREGQHNITKIDWIRFLRFLKGKYN